MDLNGSGRKKLLPFSCSADDEGGTGFAPMSVNQCAGVALELANNGLPNPCRQPELLPMLLSERSVMSIGVLHCTGSGGPVKLLTFLNMTCGIRNRPQGFIQDEEVKKEC